LGKLLQRGWAGDSLMGHVAEQGLSVQQSLALEATFPETALDLLSGIGLADKTN